MNFVEPIRDRKKIAQIKNLLRGQERFRDLLLFVVGINSALRISDLLELQVAHFLDDQGSKPHLIFWDLTSSRGPCFAFVIDSTDVLTWQYIVVDFFSSHLAVMGSGSGKVDTAALEHLRAALFPTAMTTAAARCRSGRPHRGCQPAGFVAVRETGRMSANMLRAFQVGKALTSDREPSIWMRPSRVA
jgi:hypothetical protein